MGIEWFNCGHCDEATPDCDCDCIEINNLETSLGVCMNCKANLTEEGYLEIYRDEPDWGYLTRSLDTGKIQYFDTWEEFLKTCKDLCEPSKWNYGFWRCSPKYLPTRLKDALLQDNNCGGHSISDIPKICAHLQKIKDNQQSSLLMDVTLYIGWRNHDVERYLEIRYYLKKDTFDPDNLTTAIQRYAKRHGLTDTPFLITSYGCNLEYDYRQLERFCFPERNEDVSWFTSLEDLETQKWSPQFSTANTEWNATPKFLLHHIKKCKSKKEYYEKRLQELESVLSELQN